MQVDFTGADLPHKYYPCMMSISLTINILVVEIMMGKIKFFICLHVRALKPICIDLSYSPLVERCQLTLQELICLINIKPA